MPNEINRLSHAPGLPDVRRSERGLPAVRSGGSDLEAAVELERLRLARDQVKLADRNSSREHERQLAEIQRRHMAVPRQAPPAPAGERGAPDMDAAAYAHMAWVMSCVVFATLVTGLATIFREFAFAIAVGAFFVVVLVLALKLGREGGRYGR